MLRCWSLWQKCDEVLSWLGCALLVAAVPQNYWSREQEATVWTFSLEQIWAQTPELLNWLPKRTPVLRGATAHQFIINGTYVYSNHRTVVWKRAGGSATHCGCENQRVVEQSEEKEGCRAPEVGKMSLIAERNSHPIAHRLWVKCKCIPQQPRNKQAATSFAYN